MIKDIAMQTPQAALQGSTSATPEQKATAVDVVSPNGSGKELPATQSNSGKSDPVELEQAVKELENLARNYQRNLQFSIDKDLGATVVKVIDPSTKDVIRQIPSETMLNLARNLEKIKGILFDAEA